MAAGVRKGVRSIDQGASGCLVPFLRLFPSSYSSRCSGPASPGPGRPRTRRRRTSTLNGTVTLQGLTVGTAGYQVALDVRFFRPGTSDQVTLIHTTTLADGTFSVSGVSPGTNDVEVKEAKRLGRIARNLSLPAGE